MQLIKKFIPWMTIICFLVCAISAQAGTPDKKVYGLRLKDEGSAHSTPPDGYYDIYVVDDIMYGKNDGGTAVALASGSGDNTLDDAYDQGGAGSGRTITADGGSVTITNTDADTAFVLDLTPTPSSSAALGGLHVTVGANSTEEGIEVTNSGSGSDIKAGGGAFTVDSSGNVVCNNLTPGGSTYLADIDAAASGNANMTIDAAGNGTITLGGTSTGKITTDNAVELFGNVDVGNAATDTLTITSIIDGNVTIDDGATDSPKLIFKDSDDEQHELYADQSTDDLNVECANADDSLAVTVGNLSAGTPNVSVISMDGGDLFVADDVEIDGTLVVDTDIDLNGTMDVSGTVALSENVTFTMAADEYLKLDADTTAMTQTSGAIDLDIEAGATSVRAIDLNLEAENTFANMYGIYIDVDDDASGGEETVDCIYIANSAGTASVVNGIQLANTLDVGIDAVMGASGQIAVIDATTTANTETDGVLDMNYRTATTTGSAIYLDVESDVAGGASEVVYGLRIQLDDDANTSTDSVSAIYVNTDGDGTGLQYGLNVAGTGIDYAVYAQTGSIRIGTGSTPDQTPGDDDLFVEGTAEVDGNVYFDGHIVGDGATEIYGIKHDVIDCGDKEATPTIATAGSVFINSEAVETALPEASTCIGCEFTFAVAHASNFDINPDDADKILGATDSTGDMIRSSTVGDTVTLVAIDSTNWVVKAMYPASTDWADAN